MTDRQHDPKGRVQPDYDELQAKRYGRQVRDWIQYRDEVLAGDPDSVVPSEAAAAILGLRLQDLVSAMDDGRLGYKEIDGERIIRVADLQVAFEKDQRRRQEFADGWSQLQAKLDWDE
ncbi:hypothetical protein GCM10011575_30360 [Microlunatus endophyticus]|uniref:Helix-turn-helix domain-containing protein n=1 Tax=Microlunatus endophyticus TaxID=1716077 RepID=A0A917SCA1_9ACTN|nr:hypothetical protein [Microlunatus endophyticus]GGL69726.1 hypothetical protein GCM10011575_30360 [Microlunatus endophyticus]